MPESSHPVERLLREDRRYKLDAYAFVFEALSYAHDVLGLGAEKPSEPDDEPAKKVATKKAGKKGKEAAADQPERHLTGQQLCEAIRLYALEQYGYMAKCVLNSWGVSNTGDFGEIVFNLIRIKQMKKTKDDRREDFNEVYDFEVGLKQSYKITAPREKK
ncbi:MAG: Minf_1886 family protein [Pirellulales bacterium]